MCMVVVVVAAKAAAKAAVVMGVATREEATRAGREVKRVEVMEVHCR